jgi:hypothetical protein
MIATGMNKSESITNIAKAMALFQAEVENPKNTANNPFFKSKYAPLNEILAMVRPLLTKHGLSIMQTPSGDGQRITVSTILMHSSGEWIEPEPLQLIAKAADPQGAGSAITYGRRYALAAVLGISSEDDDDGNHATQPNKAAAPAKPKQADAPKINEQQRKKLFAMVKDAGMTPDAMREHIHSTYSVVSSNDLTQAQAAEVIDWLDKRIIEKREKEEGN